ncbi:hypothetical protein P9112_003933 [Eukaryota sp. TZLM1-RC]
MSKSFVLRLHSNDTVSGASIISFASQPPLIDTLDPESSNPTEFRRFVDSSQGSRKRRKSLFISAQNDKQLFCSDVATHPDPYNYAIGLVEPGSKRMNVLPCQPPIALYQQFDRLIKEDENSSRRERYMELVSTFGSKKRQQNLKTRMANQIDETSLDHSAFLVDSIADSLDPALVETDPDALARLLLPKFDKDTTDVSKIYPVETLTEVWDDLPYKWIFHESDSDLWCDLASFFVKQIAKEDETNAEAIKKAKLAVLLEFLVRLLRMSPSAFKNKKALSEKLGSPPRVVFDWIISTFCDSTATTHGNSTSSSRGYSFSQENKSKAQLLTAVIYMHLHNYTADPAPFCAAINIPLVTGIFIFRQIGCAVKTVTAGIDKSSTAVLKAPLKLPDNYKIGRKFNNR